MSATLPRRSGGMRHDLVHGGRTALRERDRAVPLDDVHRALDALAVLFERVVGAGDRAVGVREQREIEVELLHVARVGFHTGGVHTQTPDVGLLEITPLSPPGGAMAASPWGVVS